MTGEGLFAFSPNPFSAFGVFKKRKMNPGASVDIFAADLKKLAKLVDTTVSEEWLKCAVITGIPEAIQQQLKAASNVGGLTLEK